jgi:hypothetical protein
MSQVSGKVLLKGGPGISDVLVEIYNLDPGVGSDPSPGRDGLVDVSERSSAPSAVGPGARRLGSVLTERGGRFALDYDTAACNGGLDGCRPDLLLIVRAPEEMSDSDGGILHISRDIRHDAGATEAYIIRIPLQTLTDAGVPAPTAVEFDDEEPGAVIQKVSQTVFRQATIRQEMQNIAAERIAAERERAAHIETEVQNRLLEKLTGVPDALAERLNFVRPGGDVESAMFQTISKTIEGTINTKPPARGFLVLPEEQVQQFKNPDGTFRDDIPPEELEPFLFGAHDKSERPSFFVREDPLDLLRRSEAEPVLIEPDDGGGELGADRVAGNGRVGALVDPAAADPPPTVPDLVGRLVETMTSPEEAVAFGVTPRATQDDVQGVVDGFELRSGPDDMPRLRDFYNLQIAFDYVWQKAIDDGVIEGATVLSRQLQDLGGDPLGAISTGSDPIKALRKELRTVQTTHASFNLATLPPVPAQRPPNPLPPQLSGGSTVSVRPPISDTTIDTTGTNAQGGAGSGSGEPPPPELLRQIEALLNERYAFEIFAPGSVNFGILVTYRQRWSPVSYQVGDLVRTITLTPKETRKVTAKRVVKKERNVKEMENSLRVRKDEAANTARDEAEIIAKAESKTNFSLTAKGSYDIGIADGDSTVVFGKDAATNSSDTKKAFREAVIKAAQEYKDERKLEVELKEVYEDEVTETSEITNPNDELPVTYLFYELQRRFKLSEHIHRLTPVVLVAMDVPNPSRSAIDALLLTHGWIIDRVLLDDQFRKPLEYLRTKVVGDEFGLLTMAQNIKVLTGIVEELKKSYTQSRTLVNQTADLLTAQMVVRAQATAESNEGLWEKASEALTGDSDSAIDVEAARILEDAARERYERAVAQERALRAQLDSEAATLKAANDAYAKEFAEHLNCLMDLGALRLHIKENILYYMQAIWAHTFGDQVFLALHKKKVPRLASREQSYSLSEPSELPSSVTVKPGEVVLGVAANMRLESDLDPAEDFVTLAEVADLDNLLGFKANYLILPLRISNALTDFMMTPYVDSELGLHDPDEFGNYTPEEFVAYARALNEQMKRQLENGEITEEEVEKTIARLTEQYKRLLSAPRRAEDEIVVPTGSLYIEALPGVHPILEDFKLMHRAIDVKKVQAEVRKLEMENVRYAARVLADEREDPDIEKKIVITGSTNGVVVPADDA